MTPRTKPSWWVVLFGHNLVPITHCQLLMNANKTLHSTRFETKLHTLDVVEDPLGNRGHPLLAQLWCAWADQQAAISVTAQHPSIVCWTDFIWIVIYSPTEKLCSLPSLDIFPCISIMMHPGTYDTSLLHLIYTHLTHFPYVEGLKWPMSRKYSGIFRMSSHSFSAKAQRLLLCEWVIAHTVLQLQLPFGKPITWNILSSCSWW